MAKMYYSREEVLAKLGVDETKLRELVQSRKLSEFRDGGKLNYKTADVDKLASEMSKGQGGDMLRLADDDEVPLSPADSGSKLGMADSGGGPAIDLSGSGSSVFKLEDTDLAE